MARNERKVSRPSWQIMKFLSISFAEGKPYLGHDGNFAYSDGTKVKYFKVERHHQIKHGGWNDWDELLSHIKLLDIDLTQLDAIVTGSSAGINTNLGNIAGKIDNTLSDCPMYFLNHHLAHSLSCWPLKNYDKVTTSFVCDGSGHPFRLDDNIQNLAETITVFNSTTVKDKMFTPQILSFGLALEILGKKWGIQGHRNDLAGKLMGLQSYGNIDPDLIKAHKFDNIKTLDNLFESSPDKIDVDWIRTIHHLVEEYYVDYFESHAKSDEYISYSGGIAQNILINSKLREWNNNIIIPPHSNDEGLSLGGLEFLRLLFKQEPFDNSGFPYWQNDEVVETPSTQTIKKTAELIARGKIVGWCQGKGEIGPRALGNRSILMRPDIEDGKNIINNRVKHREWYRPFGCSVLLEEANKYFECDFESPYMLYDVKVRDRKTLASITHIDGTTRPQTVTDGPFAELLEEVRKLTGSSVVLNTSLNINGKPIATPEIAASMNKSNMGLDAVIIGNNANIA
jgi:carbamoyltransferase